MTVEGQTMGTVLTATTTLNPSHTPSDENIT